MGFPTGRATFTYSNGSGSGCNAESHEVNQSAFSIFYFSSKRFLPMSLRAGFPLASCIRLGTLHPKPNFEVKREESLSPSPTRQTRTPKDKPSAREALSTRRFGVVITYIPPAPMTMSHSLSSKLLEVGLYRGLCRRVV